MRIIKAKDYAEMSRKAANIIAAQSKPKDPNALKWSAPHWNPAPPTEEQK
jgi:hypothetical protein